MNFVGNLDSIKNNRITGWYADSENLSTPLTLKVEINGAECFTFKADKYRADVKAAGIGNGEYGFDIDLSIWTGFPGDYVINIKSSENNTFAPGMPVHFVTSGQYSVSTGELIATQQPLPPGSFMSVETPKKITRGETLRMISEAQTAGRQVVVLPPFIDWNIALFQRPQHVARAMAESGILFLYCTVGYHDTSDGFYELEPNLLWTNRFEEIEPELAGVWFELYSTNPFPDSERLALWKRNGNKLIYEYVDHIDETISGSFTGRLYSIFESLNNDLIDLFVATAKNLYDELVDRFGDSKVVLSPNGVDVKHYIQEVPPAEAMQRILAAGKPVVGYFGALAQWLDYDLMHQLAEARQDLSFVYIGPEYDLNRDLPVAPNLYWLGKIDYSELPKYGRYFDICFIPFKQGRIAETTSPLKLFEYFALQKPVVVTSWMTECVAFKEVLHGDSVERISSVISAGLAVRHNEKFKERLLQQAINNSWKNRAAVMSGGMTAVPTHIARISIKTNRGVIVGSGSFEVPYKDVPATFIPNNKSGSMTFGFGRNELAKGDYVSLSIPIPADIPVFSGRIKLVPPAKNLDTLSFAKYQVFTNGKLVLECPMTSSVIANEIVIFSNIQISEFEIRIVVLKHTDPSWNAGSAWRLRLENLELDHTARPAALYVQCSDSHARVIRKPSAV